MALMILVLLISYLLSEPTLGGAGPRANQSAWGPLNTVQGPWDPCKGRPWAGVVSTLLLCCEVELPAPGRPWGRGHGCSTQLREAPQRLGPRAAAPIRHTLETVPPVVQQCCLL